MQKEHPSARRDRERETRSSRDSSARRSDPLAGVQDRFGNRDAGAIWRTHASRNLSGPLERESASQAFTSATAGGGHDLPYRKQMEHMFGENFAGVRAHVGAKPGLSVLGASAAAAGETVAFASAQPDEREVAHELTHVVQQRHYGSTGKASTALSQANDAAEREAERAAGSARTGEQFEVREAPTALISRRERKESVSIDESMCTEPTMSKTEDDGGFRKASLRSVPAAPQLIIPDDSVSELQPGQMLESKFKLALAAAIDDQFRGTGEVEAPSIGRLFVGWLEVTSGVLRCTLEEVVSEMLQMNASTAQGYIDQLALAIPAALMRNVRALRELLPENDVSSRTDATPPAGDDVPTPEKLREQFPEVTQEAAATLAPQLPSVWGILSAMLQGTIFHSIISAGYLFGRPPVPHPEAEINRGRGVLGRKRTDIRNPATSVVMEIKPEGDSGGGTQLDDYVDALQKAPQFNVPAPALWHRATGLEPGEDWPPSQSAAVYDLSTFGINAQLIAYQDYAAEPGMIYYRLGVATPLLVPVYAPKQSPQEKKKYNFLFPFAPAPIPVSDGQPVQPDWGGSDTWRPPQLSSEQQGQVAATGVFAGFLMFLALAGRVFATAAGALMFVPDERALSRDSKGA